MGPWIKALFWLAWLGLVLAFVTMFGCGALFGLSMPADTGAALGLIGMLGSLVVFIFAMYRTFRRGSTGDSDHFLILAILLAANFIILGSCKLAIGVL